MKILSVLAAVLILVSGFDLCGDTGLHDGKVKTELSKENGKKQDPETGCSPFCHCTRCSFSLLPESLSSLSFQSPLEIRFFISPDSVPAGIHCTVWQPPKAV